MALGRLEGMPLSRPPRDHRRALITFGWAFLPNERQTIKSYYEVPSDILADREALVSWAGEAIRAGMDSQGWARTGK